MNQHVPPIDGFGGNLDAAFDAPVAEAYEMEDGTVAILAYRGADFQVGQRFYTTPPVAAPAPDEFVCPYCFDQGAAPAVPLTRELLQRHAMFAADAPPSSAVVLLSSLHRLLGITGGSK